MRWGRVLNGVMAGAGLLALAGCGRGAEYQYLEVPDGQTFAKVPAGWTIDSAGWTDFLFVDEAALNSAFVPGDNPIAWTATFNETTDGALPIGLVTVQSVDVRRRAEFLLGPRINPVPGSEELSRVKVRVGDLEGWRAQQKNDRDGTVWITDHLILTDDRRSTMYYVGIQCTETCHDRHSEEIEEVLTTFRVES